ncbi:MAG: type I restriction enzyme HsdR N-terminal domain-containing protein, partial [Rikenellaceae bacterium]|nr:type I restriction enzyme HsdR N-terminal domain-containing protein [Rikenellaceae bacterium]
THECGVALHSVCQEYAVCVNGQPQRADVVVCGNAGEPILLAECKEPTVELDSSVRDQAMRYNAVVGARYVLLTNGVRLQGWERTAEGYRPMKRLPDLRAK